MLWRFLMWIIPLAIVVLGLGIPRASGNDGNVDPCHASYVWKGSFISWVVILVLLTLFVLLAGYLIKGKLLGCLIDSRNQMSLSRLQTIVWTILIISAFLAEALIRTRADCPSALAISVPEQLWIVLGISVTSLVGSPLIRNSKKDKDLRGPQESARVGSNMAKLAGQDMVSANDIMRIGRVVVKRDADQARLSDMFKGDEVTDCSQLDLGKIQMFYFTLILVIAYGAQLGSLFLAQHVFESMPVLDSSMVALLGISHAGYLGNKATPG
jgi:hypothetical protein